MAKDKVKDYKAEGYQIYVRVPGGDKVTAEDVQEFLDHLAHLLTDAGKGVKVDPYVEDDTEVEKAQPKGGAARSGGGGGAGAKTAAATRAAGGRRSPLYPMYVCHGKM
jgi:hypothetical protein